MDTSDPIISNLNIQSRLWNNNKKKNLPVELNLLAVSEIKISHSDDDDDSNDQESENIAGLPKTFEALDDLV